jgi:hypothetical protein
LARDADAPGERCLVEAELTSSVANGCAEIVRGAYAHCRMLSIDNIVPQALGAYNSMM